MVDDGGCRGVESATERLHSDGVQKMARDSAMDCFRRRTARRWWVAAAAILFAGAPAVVRADYEAGLRAYEEGLYETAVAEWQELAAAGDPRAQHGLGLLYETGAGVPKVDFVIAVMWYEKAAAQGLPASQSNLALMYAEGRGLPRDPVKAAQLWRQAAGAGHPMAQFNLGLGYYRGDGLSKDYTQAAEWFKQAAASDVPDAQYALAEMFRLGRGVGQSDSAARHWYGRAAANGNIAAARQLQIYGDAAGGAMAAGEPSDALAQPPPQQSAVGDSPPGGAPASTASTSGDAAADGTASATVAVAAAPSGSAATIEEAPAASAAPPVSGPIEMALPVALPTTPQTVHRVWLMSFASPEAAEQSWAELKAGYPDLLGGLQLSVKRVDLGVGGGMLYRVMAGPFPGREAARDLCKALRQRAPGEHCMAVIN